MEQVKNVYDGEARPGQSTSPERPGWLARIAAWPGSTGDRATTKDPTLWMHRDVTT